MAADAALDLVTRLIEQARRAGADAADCVLADSTSLSLAYRLGELERLERSESGDIGLRVFVGRRQALVSSADRSEKALDDLVERAVAMARAVPEDPFAGLAEPGQLAGELPDLDICDPSEPAADTLIDLVRRAEDSARAIPGVTNSEGAEASWGRSQFTFAASNGFSHSHWMSSSSISVSVLAGGNGQGMERDYDYSSAVYFSDMRSPEDVGHGAGHRAVARLGARKVKTCKVPVILNPRVARGLLGHLTSAINGAAVARGTSFLKGSLGQAIFSPAITIVDDPHRRRGLRSRPCDAEGVANRRRNLVENGVLTTWLLDLRSARQLGLQSTGHATRGTSSPPSPSSSNVWLEPGPVTPAELMEDISEGFYITELFGQGVNGVTGDYSRGAAGFWIIDGELAYPVSEVTVAGNLKDMFRSVSAASDLEFRYGVDSPTLRIEDMTVAGA